MTEDELKKLERSVRDAVACYLEAEADGDELLLKEVWEGCASDEEIKAVADYARKLAKEMRRPIP